MLLRTAHLLETISSADLFRTFEATQAASDELMATFVAWILGPPAPCRICGASRNQQQLLSSLLAVHALRERSSSATSRD